MVAGFAKKALIPLREVFGDSFEQGTVEKISPTAGQVVLSNGKEISYDYLVIATGTTGPFPGKLQNDCTIDQALDLYKDACEKVGLYFSPVSNPIQFIEYFFCMYRVLSNFPHNVVYKDS